MSDERNAWKLCDWSSFSESTECYVISSRRYLLTFLWGFSPDCVVFLATAQYMIHVYVLTNLSMNIMQQFWFLITLIGNPVMLKCFKHFNYVSISKLFLKGCALIVLILTTWNRLSKMCPWEPFKIMYLANVSVLSCLGETLRCTPYMYSCIIFTNIFAFYLHSVASNIQYLNSK